MRRSNAPNPHHRRTLAALALAAAAALPGAARANLVSEGDGDYGVVPLYRAFVFGGIDRDGDGGFFFDDINGIDYVSNSAPKALASTYGNFSANGASMTMTGWSAWSGFYAARSFASISVNNANAGDGYYLVAGQGSATSVRFYTAEAASARATFTFHVSGTESNPLGVGKSTSRLDFAATTETGKNWNGLFDGSLSTLYVNGAGTYTYTLPVADLGTAINMYFWASAFTEVKAGTFAQGSNLTMTANYGSTFVLDDVQLYDENDHKLSNWTLEDTLAGQNVFDQDGRIADVLPAPAVPEPGTWALMLAGLALVSRLARRRAG